MGSCQSSHEGRIICLAAAAVQKVYLEYQCKLEKEVNEMKKATQKAGTLGLSKFWLNRGKLNALWWITQCVKA